MVKSRKCERGLNFEASQKLDYDTIPVQHRIHSSWICESGHHSHAGAPVLEIPKVDKFGLKTATRISCDRGPSK